MLYRGRNYRPRWVKSNFDCSKNWLVWQGGNAFRHALKCVFLQVCIATVMLSVLTSGYLGMGKAFCIYHVTSEEVRMQLYYMPQSWLKRHWLGLHKPVVETYHHKSFHLQYSPHCINIRSSQECQYTLH